MDQIKKLDHYRTIVRRVLGKHAAVPASDRKIESVVIGDPIHDHYLLMDLGLDHAGRAHDIVVHLRLKDGKVWVEWDGIEYGIARDLIKAGIPKEDIFFPYEAGSEVLSESAAA